MTTDLGVWMIDRTSMNAFEDEAFRQAVQAAGRRRLIVGGSYRAGRCYGAGLEAQVARVHSLPERRDQMSSDMAVTSVEGLTS